MTKLTLNESLFEDFYDDLRSFDNSQYFYFVPGDRSEINTFKSFAKSFYNGKDIKYPKKGFYSKEAWNSLPSTDDNYLFFSFDNLKDENPNRFYNKEDIPAGATIFESINEDKRVRPRDLFTKIMDDLSRANTSMEWKTAVHDIKLGDKYEDNCLGVDYRVDGFVDITIRTPSEDDFYVARRIADAYDAEFIEPVKEKYYYKAAIRIPDEY